jgi:hypothetical protein
MHVLPKPFTAFWYWGTAAHLRIQTKSIIYSPTFALGCGGPGVESLSPTLLVLPLSFHSSLEFTMKFCFVPFSLLLPTTFVSLQKLAQAARVQVVSQIIDALLGCEIFLCDQLSGGGSRVVRRSRRNKACTAVVFYGGSGAEYSKGAHFERVLVYWFIHLGEGLG